jgi:hypothetical protein
MSAGRLKTVLTLLLFFFLPTKPTFSAQTSQFLPEIDAYYKMSPAVSLDFQSKETREAGDPTQAEIGPSLDWFVKPLISLENIRIFDPDKAKSRLLQLFAGYRVLPSPDKPSVQRLEVGFISNLPLPANILLSDRNRADLDWCDGALNWRYRNGAKIQRTVSIGSYKPAPYAGAEFFYLSQYQKWSTTALSAGTLFPVGKPLSLDIYYEHQNLTGNHPNQQLNQLGAILNVYLSRAKDL